MRLGIIAAAVGTAVVLASPAAAQERVFRYATTGDILGLDPHVNNEGPTNTMKDNLYGRLLHRLPDLSLEPDLAVSWERVDDTTWRFALREGVTFHNGNPFTADDVVYSFERQSQDGAEMAFAIASVLEVRKLDDHTIEIVTDGPDPVLLLSLPHFYIVDKEFMEENAAFEVVRGAGRVNFANLNANGTGPFKLLEWIQDNRVVLEPNENWWNHGNREDNIDRAVFTPIANDATRVAALLSGEIDLIYPVPLQDIPRLETTAGLEVLQGPELRTIFLGMDQWRDELLDMPGSGRNPFKDQRVRQAFAHAIDLDAIHRVVMRGASMPTGLMIAPGVNGFQEDMNQPYAHDPERARQLLAEAGYAAGFPVTLDCPNDRYINDEAICTAIVPMLERIGIDVTLNATTKSIHFNKIGQAEDNSTSFYMLGWTANTFDAHNALQNLMTMGGAGQGTWNCGRYSNQRVEELTDLIAVTVDDKERDALIREAFQIHKDDVGHIPLHQQVLAWGVRTDKVADVALRPFNDVDLRTVVLK